MSIVYLTNLIKKLPHDVTVSARGIANGLSYMLNDGADFGPDTKLGATAPNQYGPPYTRTSGIQEAINYMQDGSTLIIEGGLYNLPTEVTITNKRAIRIIGRNRPLINDAVGNLTGLFVLGDQLYDITIEGLLFNGQGTTTADIALLGSQLWSNYNGNTGMNIYIHDVGVYGAKYGIAINPNNSSSIAWQGVILDRVYDNQLIEPVYGITLPNYTVGNATVYNYSNGGNILRVTNSSLNRGLYQIGYYLFAENTLFAGLLAGPATVYARNIFLFAPNTSWMRSLNTSGGILASANVAGSTVFIDGAHIELNLIVSGITGAVAFASSIAGASFLRAKGIDITINSSLPKAGIFTSFNNTTPGAPNIIDLDDIYISYTGSAIPTYDWLNFPGSASISSNVNFSVKNVSIYGNVALTRVYVPNLSTPAMPASGTAQQNTYPYPVGVALYGGTVTAITITRNGTTYTVFSNSSGAALSGQTYRLEPGDSITLTYSSAPTWTWLPA